MLTSEEHRIRRMARGSILTRSTPACPKIWRKFDEALVQRGDSGRSIPLELPDCFRSLIFGGLNLEIANQGLTEVAAHY